MSSHPFFTIGVPTYNRHGLLRKTLDSILTQNFTDFEVLVGNDFTSEILTGEILGITDRRIRYINHPVNLREVGNMNSLLAAARGRYFTWLFDDDLHEPDFLQTVHATLCMTDFPPALYTSYRVIDDVGMTLDPAPATGNVTILNGAEFLESYFTGQLRLISTCGVFETSALAGTIGGVEEVCDSAIGLYCEYLFLVKCGAFDRVIYQDIPSVIFRAHPDSWGESNTELHKYREAGPNLIHRCAEALRHISRHSSIAATLIRLCKIHLVSYATKLVQYEVKNGNTGICGRYRAIMAVSREAAAMRKICIEEVGTWNLQNTVSLLEIQIHCFRFILGKFRVHV